MSGSRFIPGTLSSTAVREHSFVVQVENASLSGVVLRELTRATLQSGKSLRFTARGYSMAPFIRDGDLITIVPCESSPRPGEVLAFVNADTQRLTVHRLISRTASGSVLKGDNVGEPDGFVPDAQLLGRVARVERAGRTVPGVLGMGGRAIALLSWWNLPIAVSQAYHFPRRISGKLLRRAQRLSAYPALVRPWSPRVDIFEADTADLIAISRCILPGVWQRPPAPVAHVTRYVAKAGVALAGFVQLIRHPPQHVPYAGYWLNSHYVWTRYRRLGIGERLIRQAMAQARKDGAWELRLLVSEIDACAIGLYRKLGFVRMALPALDQQLVLEPPPRRHVMSVRLAESSRIP